MMNDDPDVRLPDDDEDEVPPRRDEGDNIVVHGDVKVGGVVGRGSVRADYIAGRDINLSPEKKRDAREFADLMVELKSLIVKAHKSGELDEKIARKALKNLSETAQMVTDENKPPKSQILRRLQYIQDILDMAVDLFSAEGGPAQILLKALPVVSMLIKIASRIF
jgi:hypothetical protein